jgi:hypothetical protein
VQQHHGQHRAARRRLRREVVRAAADRIDTHRRIEVLEVAVAEILDLGIEAVDEAVAHLGRDDDATRPRQRAQPRRQVHPRAPQLAFFDHHVGHVRADAQPDRGIGRAAGVERADVPLDREGTGDRLRHRRQLDQQSVTRGSHQPPSMFGQDLGAQDVDEAQPAREHVVLVRRHQAHGLDDIDEQHDPTRSRGFEPVSINRTVGHAAPLPSCRHPRPMDADEQRYRR